MADGRVSNGINGDGDARLLIGTMVSCVGSGSVSSFGMAGRGVSTGINGDGGVRLLVGTMVSCARSGSVCSFGVHGCAGGTKLTKSFDTFAEEVATSQ